MCKKEYCVYRYVYKNSDIIYIGKTDSSLKQRIDAHRKEEKFKPYLDNSKVDFVYLANRVETDIVEKFLINKYKPVLNEKDHVLGLSSMFLTIPDWIPYEKYCESKNKKSDLDKALKQAISDELFFDAIYNALCSKQAQIITKELHISGCLPIKGERKRVTNRNIICTPDGYLQNIIPGIKNEIIENAYQIQSAIWEPVAKVWSFSDEQKKELAKWDTLLNFSQNLANFKRNGYDENLGFGANIIRFENGFEIEKYYKDMFSSIFECEAHIYGEIDRDAYSKINGILENICKHILSFYKASGVISTKDEI